MKADRQVNAVFQLQVVAVLLLYAIWSRSVVVVSVKVIQCYKCQENITDLTNISTKCGSELKNCTISTDFCGALTVVTDQQVVYVEDCFPHSVCSDTSVVPGCPDTCHAACCQDDFCNNYLSKNTNISQLIRNHVSTNPTVPTKPPLDNNPSVTKSPSDKNLSVTKSPSDKNPSVTKSPSDKNPSVTRSPSSATRNTYYPFIWMLMLLLWIM